MTTRPAPEHYKAADLTEGERRVQWIRERSLAAQKLARKIRKRDMDALAEVNEFLLACKINDVLQDFESQSLLGLLNEKTEMFFKLASVVSSQSSERQSARKLRLDFQKYRDQVKEKAQEIRKAAQEGKDGTLSLEVLERIEEAASLL